MLPIVYPTANLFLTGEIFTRRAPQSQASVGWEMTISSLYVICRHWFHVLDVVQIKFK